MPLRWLWRANVLKIEACEHISEAIRAAQGAIPETWLALFGEIATPHFRMELISTLGAWSRSMRPPSAIALA